jgi:hypothetical protein
VCLLLLFLLLCYRFGPCCFPAFCFNPNDADDDANFHRCRGRHQHEPYQQICPVDIPPAHNPPTVTNGGYVSHPLPSLGFWSPELPVVPVDTVLPALWDRCAVYCKHGFCPVWTQDTQPPHASPAAELGVVAG